MNVVLLFFISTLSVSEQNKLWPPRIKRDAIGVLDIQTNHAQPIHADVKQDNPEDTEKPCPNTYKDILPSNIESGTVFQVTPPKELRVYDEKSLRKSLPINNQLDIVRGINRMITIAVLLVSVAIEIYPTLTYLYDTTYEFLHLNKY